LGRANLGVRPTEMDKEKGHLKSSAALGPASPGFSNLDSLENGQEAGVGWSGRGRLSKKKVERVKLTVLPKKNAGGEQLRGEGGGRP